MHMRIAALAACLAAFLACAPAMAADRLTLDDAIRRVEQAHPDLRLVGAKRDVLQDAIALVKKEITDFPLQYGNFRD